MKHFIYITFCLCSLLVRCQTAGEVSKIGFTTLTRGFQKQVFISKDSVIEIIDGRQEANKVTKKRIDKSEWDLLTESLKQVDVAEVPSLPAPSSRRAFDGARHSTITLTTTDGKEWMHTFDDESPHPKLKALMEAILRIESDAPQH